MYETLFDIREITTIRLVFNWIFFTVLFVIIATLLIVAWKIKSKNKIESLSLFCFAVVIVFITSSYFIRKGKAIDKLENGKYELIENDIAKIIKSGKYVVVKIGGTYFTIAGNGIITPYFSDKEMLEELASSEAKIRLKHVNGHILVLEKKVE